MLSAVGIVDFIIISLYQMGVIRHLPDPPGRIFDSDKVNASNCLTGALVNFIAFFQAIPEAVSGFKWMMANISRRLGKGLCGRVS